MCVHMFVRILWHGKMVFYIIRACAKGTNIITLKKLSNMYFAASHYRCSDADNITRHYTRHLYVRFE